MVTGSGKVTIETLQRLVAAFNAHDLDAVMSFFTDDPVLELPRRAASMGPEISGPGGGARRAGEPLAGIPDVHYGEDRHWLRLVRVQGRQDRRKDSYWKRVER